MDRLQQLERALIAADAAGDTQAATILAGEVRKLRDGTVSQAGSAMAAENMGPLDSLAVAAGQGFDKAAMGLRELALKGVRAVAPDSFAQAADRELQAQAADEAVKDSAYAGLRAKRPMITGLGQAAPEVAATAGMGLIPAAVTVAGMEALKPGDAKERATNAVKGGVGSFVGGVVGNAVGKLVSPVAAKATSAAQQAALQAAERVGYKPRLSETTGSQTLARLEDWAARTPGGAGVMRDFAEANQRAVNQRAASSIGEKADELTAGVFGDAADRIGKVYESLKGLPGKIITVSPAVGNAADEVLRVQAKMLPAERDAALKKAAEQAKLLATNNGKLDAEAYQLIRSGLSHQSYEASGTNRQLYGTLLNALDDAAEQSLRSIGQKGLADALKEARPQYANLKLLEKGAVAKGGNVTPSAVAGAMRQQNPGAFREGRMAGNPLYDIAVVGEGMRPLQAGSQTYERTLMSNPLMMALLAAPAYGAAKFTTGALPRGYANLLATNQLAQALAQPVSQLASPVSRGLGNVLTERLLLPSAAVPQFTE